MEVNFLRLPSRKLDKKGSKKGNGCQETCCKLFWRRGSSVIFQSLALNLHIVLTALVIWFLRWQIRNIKLHVGKLLEAGTLIAEVTADGETKAAQGRLFWACRKSHQTQTKKLLKLFPLFRKLHMGQGQLLVHVLWLMLECWAFSFPGTPGPLAGILKGIISMVDSRPKDI